MHSVLRSMRWLAVAGLAAAFLCPVRSGVADTLEKRQATINGMVVRRLDSGKFTGMAIGIIATAGKDAESGAVSIRGDIGEQMKSALREAERYVRVTHQDLGQATIEVSFEERYSPKDGGSAGTAFAVLLRSLIEGYDIDPKVAITGDIAVNGTVQTIGGTVAKIRGAMTDGCTVVIVPEGNAPAVADLFVGRDRMDYLEGLQIFSVETVDDAVSMSRKERPEDVQAVMAKYAQVQKLLKDKGPSALRHPTVQQDLEDILKAMPNHLSATFARDIGQGKGPRFLTRSGSVVEVFAAARPFWDVVYSGKPGITRADLPESTVRDMKRDLAQLTRQTHPDVRKLRSAMLRWIDAVDRMLETNRRPTSRDIRIIEQRRANLREELDRLNTDEELVERMMREGY